MQQNDVPPSSRLRAQEAALRYIEAPIVVQYETVSEPAVAHALERGLESTRARLLAADVAIDSGGRIAEVLVTVADTLESRVDRQLAMAIRLMEPALLMVLAGVVLFIFMSLIVPMLKMSSAL